MNERLPKYMHIGTQKAGSTYLYNLLAEHPAVGLSNLTEVNFFSEQFARGPAWYLNAFPNDDRTIIDCSPTYFKYGATAAARIAEVYGEGAGDLRFVLLLRNPIDYVHSHFTMQRMQGYFAKRPDLYPVVPDTTLVCARMYPNYLARGAYANLLTEWFQYFDRSQFLIIPFEAFVADQDEVIASILSFWNLPEKKLSAPSVSTNRALRYSFLSQIRDQVISRPRLKATLKHNWLFQKLFTRVLTVATADHLPPEGRRELAAVFAADVRSLGALGVDTRFWRDFVDTSQGQ
jgi:hypothetical protein